jgi:hypothetical protein
MPQSFGGRAAELYVDFNIPLNVLCMRQARHINLNLSKFTILEKKKHAATSFMSAREVIFYWFTLSENFLTVVMYV